jgi:putative glutamine amidotransferase
MQLLNVTLGGDLIQHIPDHFGERVIHRDPERLPVEHPVRIDEQSRLGTILGTCEMSVHSIHHQAVGRVADGLRAVAWSPDGVVEAVESSDGRFLLAVQWHPELAALGDARQRRIFELLVAEAARSSAACPA